MSERYGACRMCRGTGRNRVWGGADCTICGGTGYSGDAYDLIDPAYALRMPRQARPVDPDKRERVMQRVINAVNSKSMIVKRKPE
jgi:hypothetical protein